MPPEDPTLPAAESAPMPVSASPHRQSWRRCEGGARSPGADMAPAISRQRTREELELPAVPSPRAALFGRSQPMQGRRFVLGTKAQNARDAGAVKSALQNSKGLVGSI
jgi:hypothetical protein